MIVFDMPILLYSAPLVGVFVFGFALWARRARVSKAGKWSEDLRLKALSSGRWGPLLLGLVAVVAVVALAGPRWGSRVVETETKGLNLVIAIDISRSMLAEDANPSRLERAKREARRLIQDLGGDRIGLVAFAGQSHIMSPLTVDGSALNLLVGVLQPDIASTGGSDLAKALGQGRELLLAKDDVSDRVLVVFTDGEAHDSVSEIVTAAERLRRDRIRLVLIAEGGTEPVRIPVRDIDGTFLGFQRDPSEREVATMRRDDILTAVADAAQGMLVAADVGDQAGAVRDLIAAFKRSPEATTTAAQDISRAWIPLLVAVVLLLLHTFTRPTAALAVLVLCLGLSSPVSAQGPRNAADDAWIRGDFEAAAAAYFGQVQDGEGGDTVLFNLGTAAMALGDSGLARTALEGAARSIEPDVRFRALFNLGLMELLRAESDSSNRADHLQEARRYYREALLIRPSDINAKWNFELTFELMPPESGSGGEDEPPQPSPSESESQPAAPQGLSAAQAEQILSSIAEEERQTRERLNRRRSNLREVRGRKDW